MGSAAGLVGLLLGLPTLLSGTNLLPCSDANRAFLASLVGTWDVSASSRVAEKDFEEIRGRSEFDLGLEGCAVIERYRTAGIDPASSKVVVLTAKDDGTFELARLDSGHGSFTISTGELEAEAVTLAWSRDLGDRVLRTRYVYRLDSEDRLRLEHFLSRAEGEPWELTYRAEYQRVDRGGVGSAMRLSREGRRGRIAVR